MLRPGRIFARNSEGEKKLDDKLVEAMGVSSAEVAGGVDDALEKASAVCREDKFGGFVRLVEACVDGGSCNCELADSAVVLAGVIVGSPSPRAAVDSTSPCWLRALAAAMSTAPRLRLRSDQTISA